MHSSGSVILIDDETDLAKMYCSYLNASGVNTNSFTDPLIAIEYYKKNRDKSSLIITDLKMPSINGIELATKIREIDNSSKIVLITAFDTADLQNDHVYFKALFSDILQKPIKLSVLKEKITEIISQ